MTFPNPVCIVKTIWRTLVWPGTIWPGALPSAPMSGHEFVEIEQHKNVNVQVMRCQTCGFTDVTWSHDGFPSPPPNDCERCGIHRMEKR